MSQNSTTRYVSKVKVWKSPLWLEKGPVLARLDVELTERCNNNCIHCFINQPAGDANLLKRELSTNQIKAILKQAADLGCLRVRFTGGESLLRSDFEEVYIYTRKLGIRVLIFTNATLITDKLVKLLSHIPPLEKMEVSFYGMKMESYEAVSRVEGSFQAARRGINLLLENKIPFIVKSAFLPPNKSEFQDFADWASSLPGMNKNPSYAMFFNLRSRRDSEVKNRFIKSQRIAPDEALGILARDKKSFIQEREEFCSRFIRPPGENLFNCGAGVKSGCVDAYGYFKLCLLLGHPDTIYDLKQGTLKEAVLDFFPKVRKTIASNPDYLKRCARCFLFGLCEQCPANSWLESGTLDTPVEYLCGIAHHQARFLGLLAASEKAWEVSDWQERLKKLSEKHNTETNTDFKTQVNPGK